MLIQRDIKKEFLRFLPFRSQSKLALCTYFLCSVFVFDISKAENNNFTNSTKNQIEIEYLESRNELENYKFDTGDAISLGLPNFLFLMALLSINLGLINLLPIPALDGGYILMYFIESILGRPINHKVQSGLIQTGIFFLIFLMIIITFFDIQKLFV